MSSYVSRSAFGTTDPQKATLPNPPSDSISSLAFAPFYSPTEGNWLAVGSWDNTVRLYQVDAQNNAIRYPTDQPMRGYSHNAPVLDVCWGTNGHLFSASLDHTVKMYDPSTAQTMQVAQHDAPVRNVRWANVGGGNGVLVTGSWDKTVKFWDLRSPVPSGTLHLPERCYSMDVKYPLMSVATADRHILVYDLTHGVPSKPFGELRSPLKWQTRVVSCYLAPGQQGTSGSPFPRGSCFAVGSVEGRTAFQWTESAEANKNFSFRCHRQDSVPNKKDQSQIYAINDISFHPVHGTFTTCGSDGSLVVWDKDARSKLKLIDQEQTPITCTSFNHDGSLLAYGVSYDWHKGCPVAGNAVPDAKVKVHLVKEEEVRRREVRR